jgi:site-specific recombinase XerD
LKKQLFAQRRGGAPARRGTILQTFYGTGLRASELARLRPSNLDTDSQILRVRLGRGRKDRNVPLTKADRASPCVDLVLPTWSKLPRAVPTQAQAERLVTVPAPNTAMGRRDRAVLELLYGSGIRVGECERLELRDLDLARGTVFVRTGKGRKDRVVPIAGRAALAMEGYLKHSRPTLVKDPREQAVFLNAYGARLSRKTIQAMLRAQVKSAGIQLPLTSHSLRHAHAPARRRRATRPAAPRSQPDRDHGALHPRAHDRLETPTPEVL